jgi:hypothetical protein
MSPPRFFPLIHALLGFTVLPLTSTMATEPPAFEARFENDAEGTWLVYPTIPGWHYKIESSPSPDAGDFSYLPGSFHYGDGQALRWWIAARPLK